jgi:flagellin
MGLLLNTNTQFVNSQRQQFNSRQALNSSFERLSSGFRINRAADDAAALNISDQLMSQVQGLEHVALNANDVISLVQTSKVVLDEVTASLQRIQTLAVQSRNGLNSSADQANLVDLSREDGYGINGLRLVTDTDFTVKTGMLAKEQKIQRVSLPVLIQANQNPQLRCHC